MQRERYQIRYMEEVFPMAQYLARYFERCDSVICGIHELLMNAIEHGNLEIGYEAKTQLLAEGRWEAEIAARQREPRYAGRVVAIDVQSDDHWSELRITDAGAGFDWGRYTWQAPSDATHGRGLLIAQKSGFASLQFNAVGNAVTCGGASHPNEIEPSLASRAVSAGEGGIFITAHGYQGGV